MENKFGTNSDQKFGANSNSERQKTTVINRLLKIFNLQSSGFWIKKYIYSAIAFFIYYGEIYEAVNHNLINFLILILAILNLLLYPFFASVLEDTKTGRFDNVKGISSFGLTKLFNGFLNMGVAGQTGMSFVFYQLLTFFTFIIKWVFSFILGIFSLIYMNNIAKKMGY